MKMKWLFFIGMITGIMALVSCGSAGDKNSDEWTVRVYGTVGYPQQGYIVIQELTDDGNARIDTITLSKDYTFDKKMTIREPGYYRVNFFNKQSVNIILYKTDVQVNVDGNNPQGFVKIAGSPELDLMQKIQSIVQRIHMNPEVDKLNEAFREAQRLADDEKITEIRETYNKIAKAQYDSVAVLLENNAVSLATINLLQSSVLDPDKYFDVYKDVAVKLKEAWPGYKHSKDFIAMVDRMAVLAIGQPAPEIALPDPDGNVVKLSSLKGKYVLVDFWAKWCGPCRQENPNLVKAYKQYKDKGFEIFGVSLDRTREDWLRAIQEDQLTWTHVSDLKYWESAAAETYNIKAIPFSVLLDPKGDIIGKNLRGDELDKKLEEIFGK